MLPKLIVTVLKPARKGFRLELSLDELIDKGECYTVIGALEDAKQKIIEHAKDLE